MWAWSAGKAVPAGLGLGLVLVCVVPDCNSTASPDDEAGATQRQRAIVGAFATAIVRDDHADIAEHAAPTLSGPSPAPAWCRPGRPESTRSPGWPTR